MHYLDEESSFSMDARVKPAAWRVEDNDRWHNGAEVAPQFQNCSEPDKPLCR
jgi:hypothetical protein